MAKHINLENLESGNKIVISKQWNADYVTQVIKVTKTRIFCTDKHSYLRRNGDRWGSGESWSKPYINLSKRPNDVMEERKVKILKAEIQELVEKSKLDSKQLALVKKFIEKKAGQNECS